MQQVGILGTDGQAASRKVASASSRRPGLLQRFGKPDARTDMEGIASDRAAIDRSAPSNWPSCFNAEPRLFACRELVGLSDRPHAEKIGGRCNAAEIAHHRAEIVEEIGILRCKRTDCSISSSPSTLRPVWCSSKPRKCAAAA